jgi:hydrogenase-4 component B
LLLLTAWGVVGLAGLIRPLSIAFVGRTLFPLGAVVGAALAVVALAGLSYPIDQVVLPIGLPNLPVHLRLDGLSGIFLILLGAASAGISIFAAGYFRRGEGTAPGLLCLQYHLFLSSMGFVLLADDAYAFMLAWEPWPYRLTFWSPRNIAYLRFATPGFSTC